jgi:hypothetical protein
MKTRCTFQAGFTKEINIGTMISLSREAKMYIDPNTGGILFQALAAVFAVASGTLLLFSGKIKELIARMRRRFRKNQDE